MILGASVTLAFIQTCTLTLYVGTALSEAIFCEESFLKSNLNHYHSGIRLSWMFIMVSIKKRSQYPMLVELEGVMAL